MDNHIKKLFHALWGPTFGSDVVTGEQLHSFEGLARYLHETRLQGLYFDARSTHVQLPSTAITKSDADLVLSLAKDRLANAKKRKLRELAKDDAEILRWFTEATDDDEKFKLIFGSKSMAKLRELNDGQEWMRWLRQVFDEADAESRALAEKELSRLPAEEEEGLRDKWKLKIRIFTNSHSIRAKQLQEWNTHVSWTKLVYMQKKDQFIVELVMPSAVPVAHVYDAGLEHCMKLLAALNISTRGFFWWYIPENITTYVESMMDLDSNTKVEIGMRPRLAVNWQCGVLSEQDLREVAVVFSILLRDKVEEHHEPIRTYLHGIAIMAANNLHLRVEANAFREFYSAIKQGMRGYGDWNGESPFSEAFTAAFGKAFPDDGGDRFIAAGEALESGSVPDGITLEEVAGMKVLCDHYFRTKLRQLASELRKALVDVDDTVADDR